MLNEFPSVMKSVPLMVRLRLSLSTAAFILLLIFLATFLPSSPIIIWPSLVSFASMPLRSTTKVKQRGKSLLQWDSILKSYGRFWENLNSYRLSNAFVANRLGRNVSSVAALLGNNHSLTVLCSSHMKAVIWVRVKKDDRNCIPSKTVSIKILLYHSCDGNWR